MFSRISLIGFVIVSSLSMNIVHAEETVKEKAVEAANDTKRGAKKAMRTVKEKTCSMVKGKMECAAEKVKHTIQNGADAVEDAVE